MQTWKACGRWTMSLLSWTIFSKMYREGKDCNPMYFEIKDNASYYYQTEEELNRVKDAIARKADVNFLRKKLDELRTNLSNDAEELKKINEELKQGNLAGLFERYWRLYAQTIFGMAVDIYFDDILCSKLSSYLKEKIRDKTKFNESFALLTAPLKPTTTQTEEIEFLKILLQDEQAMEQLFKSHLKKYAHIPMWCDNDPWSVKDLMNRAKLFGSKEAIQQRLRVLQHEMSHRQKKCQEIVGHLNPPQDIQELIHLIQEFAFLRQEGEVQIGYHNHHGYPLKEQICKNLHLSMHDLKYLTDKEIIENLQTKSPDLIKIIRERKHYCFVIFRDGEYFIFTGREAEERANEIKEKLKRSKVTHCNQIEGTVGSSGKVTSKVCVIHNLNEINKIKKGEIMVVSGTSVEYLLAMEKAGGIITEFGGITSHAAIIARELKKPCIIQIEDATKIFADGELVELDAEKGLITRIYGKIL